MLNRTRGVYETNYSYYIEDNAICYIVYFHFDKHNDGTMKTNYRIYIKMKYEKLH